MPSPIIRKVILTALATAIVAIGILVVSPVAVTQGTDTDTGTVTLTVNSFVDIIVVDDQIQITFQPASSQVTAWFAVNVNDYFKVTEGASNVNVTLGVYDYTIVDKPSDYPATFQNPLLLFHIGSSSGDYNGIYFNATVKANADSSSTPNVPTSLTVGGVSLTLVSTVTPIAYNVSLSDVAVYYDGGSSTVGTYSNAYLCLASAEYNDNNGNTYVIVFGKIQQNSCDYDFTSSGDYAIAAGSSNDIQDYVLTVIDPNGYQAYLRIYSISNDGSYVVLKPVVPLQYDGQETPVYVFTIVKLPVAAPQGQYRFTVTLQTWAAEG